MPCVVLFYSLDILQAAIASQQTMLLTSILNAYINGKCKTIIACSMSFMQPMQVKEHVHSAHKACRVHAHEHCSVSKTRPLGALCVTSIPTVTSMPHTGTQPKAQQPGRWYCSREWQIEGGCLAGTLTSSLPDVHEDNLGMLSQDGQLLSLPCKHCVNQVMPGNLSC